MKITNKTSCTDEKLKKSAQDFFVKKLNHIAFILDGNGRWAKKHGHERLWGHRAGAKNVVKTLSYCKKLGIKAVSLYALSAENLKRDRYEVEGLFSIFEEFLTMYKDDLVKDNIKFQVSGDISVFPTSLQQEIENVINISSGCSGMIINLCVNYGGKQEIIRAINLIIKEKIVNINEVDIQRHLYTANLPELDFVVRTGREKRLSNFMLWQVAYAELYFCKTFWPAFSHGALKKAVKAFYKRKRRFGLVK